MRDLTPPRLRADNPPPPVRTPDAGAPDTGHDDGPTPAPRKPRRPRKPAPTEQET